MAINQQSEITVNRETEKIEPASAKLAAPIMSFGKEELSTVRALLTSSNEAPVPPGFPNPTFGPEASHRDIQMANARTQDQPAGKSQSTPTGADTTMPDGSHMHTERYPNGRIHTTDNTGRPDGTTIHMEYGKDGTPTSKNQRNPDGTLIYQEYGSNGKVRSQDDRHPDGSRLHVDYDANGRKTFEYQVGKDGSISQTQFGPNGEPKSQDRIDANGKPHHYEWTNGEAHEVHQWNI